MSHQFLLKYLSSTTNFISNQTLYTLFREICRNDTFKLLLKTLLIELYTDKEEILSIKSVKPCKKRKNSPRITSEQEINPVQIPHPSNATFKFPPPRARCTVKCPGYARGGMLKFRIDRRITDGICNEAVLSAWSKIRTGLSTGLWTGLNSGLWTLYSGL